jgi:hypothetical protein
MDVSVISIVWFNREITMSITVKEILAREDFSDAAIMRHGFTDYMRDYDVIVGARNGPPNTDVHKYQFIGCVEAYYETRLGEIFEHSLTDDFVYSGPDYPNKPDPDGFIWGVRFAETWVGGLEYIDDGERARHWSNIIGRKMHEVTIETNAYFLRLVFADIRYSFLGHEPDVKLPKDYPLKINEITSDGRVN